MSDEGEQASALEDIAQTCTDCVYRISAQDIRQRKGICTAVVDPKLDALTIELMVSQRTGSNRKPLSEKTGGKSKSSFSLP